MPGSRPGQGVVAVQQANRESTHGSNTTVRQSKITERSTLNRQRCAQLATGSPDQTTRTPNIDTIPPSRYLSAESYARISKWLDDLPVRRTCRIPLVLRCLGTTETSAMASSRLTVGARTKVCDRAYRERLQSNGITMLYPYHSPPKHIQALLKDVLPAEPITSTGHIDTAETRAMAVNGVEEEVVKDLFRNLIKDRIDISRLKVVGNQLLIALDVPNIPGRDRLVTPKPNVYVGYQHQQFDDDLQDLFGDFDRNPAKFAFLGVELKGDGETSLGGLWVATNQCMAGGATFLNIQHKLQSTLLENNLVEEANALEPVIFSVASNGTEARLFATYSQSKEKFTTYFVRGFLLYDASSRATLNAYIQHIIDWGTDKRLETIKSALQALREAGVRGNMPAPPTISGKVENDDLVSSETSLPCITVSITHSHADTEVVPEPRQTKSKKRAADTQPSKPKRKKATVA